MHKLFEDFFDDLDNEIIDIKEETVEPDRLYDYEYECSLYLRGAVGYSDFVLRNLNYISEHTFLKSSEAKEVDCNIYQVRKFIFRCSGRLSFKYFTSFMSAICKLRDNYCYHDDFLKIKYINNKFGGA
jgi:hypothetical protein